MAEPTAVEQMARIMAKVDADLSVSSSYYRRHASALLESGPVADLVKALTKQERLWRALTEHFLRGDESGPPLDYDEFLAMGMEFELLKKEGFDPLKHGRALACKPGDDWYTPRNEARSALAPFIKDKETVDG